MCFLFGCPSRVLCPVAIMLKTLPWLPLCCGELRALGVVLVHLCSMTTPPQLANHSRIFMAVFPFKVRTCYSLIVDAPMLRHGVQYARRCCAFGRLPRLVIVILWRPPSSTCASHGVVLGLLARRALSGASVLLFLFLFYPFLYDFSPSFPHKLDHPSFCWSMNLVDQLPTLKKLSLLSWRMTHGCQYC